ncbi:hypothetical protein OC846_000788 [Tilletia horrida]|uniref:Uncharacterized protein n=1 Tax=Tilletia horrida TaxID=155126 RepID=A0AAN6K0J3_9BASI|nr:hypothetical protein OC846_000788 [Tilletia horrida]KAK0567822.1 hypothetical protein OC861_002491 [Tilletia horrida]
MVKCPTHNAANDVPITLAASDLQEKLDAMKPTIMRSFERQEPQQSTVDVKLDVLREQMKRSLELQDILSQQIKRCLDIQELHLRAEEDLIESTKAQAKYDHLDWTMSTAVSACFRDSDPPRKPIWFAYYFNSVFKTYPDYFDTDQKKTTFAHSLLPPGISDKYITHIRTDGKDDSWEALSKFLEIE